MKSNIDPRQLLKVVKQPNTILERAVDPIPSNRITGLLVESLSVQLVEGEQAVLKLPDGRYRVRCKGQHCGIVNRNRRRYDLPIWQRHLVGDAPFMRMVRARGVVGQLEHPDDGKSSMGLGAIVITDVKLDAKSGEVMIEFETMSTPAGKIAAAYIADGVRFGISSRGNGSVIVDENGVSVVQDDFDPVTFDLVIDESTPGAEVAAERVREAIRTENVQWGVVAGRSGKAMLLAESQARAARGKVLPLREGMLARYKFPTPEQALSFVEAARRVGWNPLVEVTSPTYVSWKLPGFGAMDLVAREHGAVCGLKENVHESRPAWAAQLLAAIKGAEGSVPNNVSEDYVVLDGSPYSGVVLELAFGSPAEAEKAKKTLEGAGFYVDVDPADEDELCVYTGFEDVDAAVAHIARVLNMNDIAPKAEESRVVKTHEGKTVETRAFPAASLIEFYGQSFPVSAEDEFELWDEEGQPTKFGATKERKGDTDDEKDERTKGKGDDADADDKDETVEAMVREAVAFVIEKQKGKGGKTGAASAPKDETKGKGDDKDDKKDETAAPTVSVLMRKTAGKPNGRLEVTRMGEDVLEVRAFDDAGKLVGFTGPQEAYRKLVAERSKGKGDAPAKDGMPDKSPAKPGSAGMGKGKGTATESRTLAGILATLPKLIEGAKPAADAQAPTSNMAEGAIADGVIKTVAKTFEGIATVAAAGSSAVPALRTASFGSPAASQAIKEVTRRLDTIINNATTAKAAVVRDAKSESVETPAPAAVAPPPAAPAKPPVPVCEAHDTKIRHLQTEVARVEQENGELRGLIEAFAAEKADNEVRIAVYEQVRAHPELLKAETKLLTCESKAAVLAESKALLGILVETKTMTLPKPAPAPAAPAQAPKPQPTSAPSVPAGGTSTTTQSSSKTVGAPTGPLVAESTPNLTGALRESSDADGLSRVANYRARKRQPQS